MATFLDMPSWIILNLQEVQGLVIGKFLINKLVLVKQGSARGRTHGIKYRFASPKFPERFEHALTWITISCDHYLKTIPYPSQLLYLGENWKSLGTIIKSQTVICGKSTTGKNTLKVVP